MPLVGGFDEIDVRITMSEAKKKVSLGLMEKSMEIEFFLRATVPDRFYHLLAQMMKSDPEHGPHIDNIPNEFHVVVGPPGGNNTSGWWYKFTIQTKPIERDGQMIDIGSLWLLGYPSTKVEAPEGHKMKWQEGGKAVYAEVVVRQQEPRYQLALQALERAIVEAMLEMKAVL